MRLLTRAKRRSSRNPMPRWSASARFNSGTLVGSFATGSITLGPDCASSEVVIANSIGVVDGQCSAHWMSDSDGLAIVAPVAQCLRPIIPLDAHRRLLRLVLKLALNW